MFPSGDYYDISLGNSYPTKRIKLFLVGIPIISQLLWVEVLKEHQARGTNTSYLFLAFKTFDISNFFCINFALAAPEIMYIDTYNIFYSAISCGYSVKGCNQDSERTGIIK